jgi:hypothetical protein
MRGIVIPNQAIIKMDDLSQAMTDFLRVNVSDGDASPKTIASYLTEVRQYALWCEHEGINLARYLSALMGE